MKSNQTLTILFWHRKSKKDANGLAPIICRISIDGMDEELSTGRKAHVDNWDNKTKRVITGQHAKMTNSLINRMQVDLERYFTVLQSNFDAVTPLKLKNIYRNLPHDHKKGQTAITAKKKISLLELADLQIKEFSDLVEKKLRSPETLKQWKATKNKIAEFLLYQKKINDMELIDIKYCFAQDFLTFLTVKRSSVLGEAAAMKQIKSTKQILKLAETCGWITKNPIEKFRCGADEPEIQPLEISEVENIWHHKLTIERLDKVRDAFIFQCFTAFAYQDIYNLSPLHIITVGTAHDKWLIKERGKTKVTEMVPILPIVEQIIKKYSNDPYCKINKRLIPVNSNYRYNCYLKELSYICGLSRELNSHLARHTFADIMLNVLDFPLEDVSKMLGHKNVRTTQRYARVKKSRIAKKMHAAKEILFDSNGLLKGKNLVALFGK
ncbi:site-specific integrase [Pedobacter sp. PAMC26386]|nr:site-specific integrase [Pedobacter sp. PAMC26386]